MKRQRRLFGLILLWHLGLTIATGLGWTALMIALGNSHTPALLDATYASFYLFVPFCQPFFWPLSNWVAHSGHFNMLPGLKWQCIEYLVIACLNSLSAVGILFGTVWLVRFAVSHPPKQAKI